MYIFNKIKVVVFVLQILMFITSNVAEKNSTLSPTTSVKTNTTKNATAYNNTITKVPSKNEEVIIEGGGKIQMQVEEPAVATSQPHNREGAKEHANSQLHGEDVVEGPVINSNSTMAATSTVISSSISPIQVHSSSSTNSSTTSSTTDRTIPIYEDKPPFLNTSEHSDHKKISPRKGVNYTDLIEHQAKLNATTVKPKPKKPTLTDASRDEEFAPSHFQSNSKQNSSSTQSIPKVPNLVMLSESNQGKTQKYVVPIVIVILSVPFVAILISILYKRGSEWWKYRHYRRMDFLINGMYDN